MNEDMEKPLLQKTEAEGENREKKDSFFSKINRKSINQAANSLVAGGKDILDSLGKSEVERTPLARLLSYVQAEPTHEVS